jgi:hypothetical protein
VRTYRLAQAAIEAEKLRLRLHVRRAIIRAVLGVLGGIALLGALAFAHAAAGLWLAHRWGSVRAALTVAAVDIVVAIILILLALRKKPTAAELEAKRLRDSAWRETIRAMTLAGLMDPLIRLAISRVRRQRR